MAEPAPPSPSPQHPDSAAPPSGAAGRLSARALWTRLLLYPGHTLPTAAAPVLVGIGLAAHDGVLAWGPAVLFLLSSWLVHVAGVFTDNHTLISRHPTLPEHPELLAAVADRTLALSTLRRAIWACLVLAALPGLALLWIGGPAVGLIGLIGLVSAVGYHGGPWPYANRGLSDPVFFVMFGVVAVAATYFLQAASLAPAVPWAQRGVALPAAAWWIGLPVGALVTAVLVIDDIRDRDWDARKGWRTTPVRFGLAGSRAEFAALLAFAYAVPPLMAASGWGAAVLLPLLTAPWAWRALQAVRRFDDTPNLFPWTPRVAKLGLAYAALQALGLALSRG